MKRAFAVLLLILLMTTLNDAPMAQSTAFSVSGGKIIAPNGSIWVGTGVDVHDTNLSALANGNGCTALPCPTGKYPSVMVQFPGINFIRVDSGNPYGVPYPDPATFASAVTTLTNAKIVVEFTDYGNSVGGGGGGGGGQIYTGTLLTNESTWFAAMANYYKNNPYVWLGTTNEPTPCYPDTGGGTQCSQGGSIYQTGAKTLSAWQSASYTAIRNTGNNNPILLDVAGSAPNCNFRPGCAGTPLMTSIDPAYILPMTNVIWDPHIYGYQNNYTASRTGSNGTDALVAAVVTQAQTVRSADGVMGVVIGEFGPAGGGPVDPNGTQIVASVLANGVSYGAWSWDDLAAVYPTSPTNSTNQITLLNSTTGLTAYGQQLAAGILADHMIIGPTTLAATQSVSANVPGVSANDGANPSDTMTFTGTSTLSGTLSAVGAGGNGTATITFTGSLTALNTLLGTITFKDTVVENPTLTFSVHDQHSNSGNATTAVTVAAGSAPGGVVPPVAGCTTTTCTGTVLPAGYLNVSGNQIKAGATNVRLACAVYGGTTGALADFQAIRAAGFNCVRLDWRDVYVAAAGTGTGPPVATLGLGSVTDGSGNVFTIDLTGRAIEAVGGSNPTVMPGGSGTNLLEKFNGQVLFESRGCSPVTWYTWNGSTFTATTTPTTLGSIAITAGSGALADCTGNIYSIGTTQHATPGSGTVTDGSGNVWTVTAGGVAQENGVTPGTNFNVTDLYLVGSVIWVVNTTPTWYYFTQTGTNAGFFTQGAAPTLTGGGGALENGTAMAGGSAMTQAELYNGVIYFNSGTNWFTWSGTAFVSATAPPPPGSGGTITPPAGCNSLTQITSCVANAASANLRVIFNHLGNEVPAAGSACITRQQNGLWFDSGTDSGGSDGCGTSGTVTAAIFQANTVTLLKAFAGNTTVIGYEFHSEPMMAGSFTGTGSPAIPPVNWGGGGPTDIQAACGTVGAAVFAQNPDVIEFCPGPINNTGTLLLNGTTSTSFSGITTTNFSDLSGVAAHPVTGFSTAKIAYSIHLFPCNVQNTSPDEPVAGNIPIWNAYFGSIVINGTAPVVNMSVGCSCDNSNNQGPDDQAFMTRWVPYANGLTVAGPNFTAGQQPMSNVWYNWGNFATANPNGILNPDGTLKGTENGQNNGQAFYWSQLLQGTVTAPVGNRPIILIFGENKLANDNMRLAVAK